MFTQQYEVCLKTQIGSKYGKLIFNEDKGIVAGVLEILEQSQPFKGIMDSKGYCKIEGTLKTLMHTINYIATGIATKEAIRLSIQEGKRIFELTGRACINLKGETV